MQLFDIKSIVKDSIREAFYTKKSLNELLIGKEISIEVWGLLGTHGEPYQAYVKFPALLSKNPVPHEKPYRLTWFTPDKVDARGHVDMTLVQFNKLMGGKSDADIYLKIANNFECDRLRINLHDEEEGKDGKGETSLVAETLIDKEKNELLLLLEDSAREVDLWLENKVEINESMNVYVKGADYSRYDTLGEICNRVVNKIFYEMSSKLPQDQQEYWKKNHAFPTYDILTPDGGEVDAPTGVVNFYISGLTQQAMRLVLKTIFDSFKQLGLTWGKIKTEQSGAYVNSKVIRIPILTNPHVGKYQGPLELNMANRNAYHIFKNVLQFEPDDESGSSFHFKADEVLERIQALAHDQGWIDKNAIKPMDTDWPEAERGDDQDFENPHDAITKQFGGEWGGGGARIISSPLGGDDIRARLRFIWQIAKWAKDHNMQDMYVG